MKLQILSDIHLEFEPFEPPVTDVDIVILAGDTATGTKGISWASNRFKDKVVMYIAGNHEFYHHSHPKLIDELKLAAKDTNVLVFENDEMIINDVRFLGCTLWTDFNLDGNIFIAEYSAQEHMNDFRLIRNSYSYSKFRPKNAISIHRSSRYWLSKSLANASTKTVVITHHAPSSKSIPEHLKSSPLNPAYASNLEDLVMEYQPDLWIHGHMHLPVDYMIGKTRVIANPKGYPHESANGFNPGLIVEV